MMSDSKERLDYAGLSHFKDLLLDDTYTHVYSQVYKKDEVYTKDEVFDNIKSEIFDTVYPVGSIYMSINETSPASLFGGEWEQIKDTFLLAAGDTYKNGETGGEATHTLSVNEMPSHSHSISSHTHSIPSLSGTAASAGSHSHSVASHTHTIPSLSGTTTSNGSHVHSLAYSYYSLSTGSRSLPLVDSGGNLATSSPVYDSGSHSHTVTTTASTSGGTSLSTSSTGAHSHSVTTNTGTTGSATPSMTTTGSGEAHNNMPPYFTVYVWQRIA